MLIVILSATLFLIFLYLFYPVWLKIINKPVMKEKETEEINSVSLILLSYNGKKYLKNKIEFLLKELACFNCYELIIIDDKSSDGSIEVLENYIGIDNIRVYLKNEHNGIPNSMNFGVKISKFEYIIFCDQRQELSEGIIKKIVEPLKFKNNGAVSGCILSHDKINKFSLIRKHENFLKTIESKTGNLIGVYGPLYSIKKKCYSVIPENIILDDLYLSLRILKTMNVVLREDCNIKEEEFSALYDYKRVKRYLSGFYQILNDKTIIKDLNITQKTMLFWHKYLRIIIPFFSFVCYIVTGLFIMKGIEYIILFSSFSALGLIYILPVNFNFHQKNKVIFRLNFFYFIAFIDILT